MQTFEGHIWFHTTAAIRFQSHYWAGPLWLPKSQIEISYDFDSLEVVVLVKPWLCEKNGFQEFTEYNEEQIAKMDEF